MTSDFITPTRRALMAGAAVALIAAPLSAQVADISGSYRVEGRNPDGSAYAGTAVVAQQQNAVQINWTVSGQSFAGSGVRNGQVVVVNWGQPTPVVYVIMPNGALHGTWADGRALDRLVPQ